MNIFIFTSRIVSLPKLSFYQKGVWIHMILCLRNSKKSKLWYNVKTFTKEKTSNYFFDVYKKGDFITIEGSIRVKLRRKNDVHNNYQKSSKLVYVKINKIYPANNII